MKNIQELVNKIEKEGYSELNAMSRISQDILLKAIKDSGIEDNVTVKGGVLIRNISKDSRRATIDLDIDFVKLSISNDTVDDFIRLLNDNSEYKISKADDIEELKHEDYKGKRVYVNIEDDYGNITNSKIDIGVHVYNEMDLENCIFDINLQDEGISLLANSKEQVVVEKLKSLLKFGPYSTRYKDIFDIEYLLDKIDYEKFEKYMKLLVYDKTKYSSRSNVHERLSSIFNNSDFLRSLSVSDKNWTKRTIDEVAEHILAKI